MRQRKKLKNLCKSRWIQRIDSYTVFYDLYASIIKTMESICACSSEYGEWSWDMETLTKARGFLHQLVSLEFLVTFNVTMKILSSLRALSLKLQKKSNDILAAYEAVPDVVTDLEQLKTNLPVK